jgi:hypothetical protein
MTFVPYYRLMIERDYYPNGEAYWFGKCSCGSTIRAESEDEAMDWGDNHNCDEEADGDD